MLSFAWFLLPPFLSCLFYVLKKQLCIFPWVDFDQAGKWTTQTIDLKRMREETRPGTMRQEIAIAAAPIVAACCLVYWTARLRQSPVWRLVDPPVQGPNCRAADVLLQQEAGNTVLSGDGGGDMLRALLYLHICQGL